MMMRVTTQALNRYLVGRRSRSPTGSHTRVSINTNRIRLGIKRSTITISSIAYAEFLLHDSETMKHQDLADFMRGDYTLSVSIVVSRQCFCTMQVRLRHFTVLYNCSTGMKMSTASRALRLVASESDIKDMVSLPAQKCSLSVKRKKNL